MSRILNCHLNSKQTINTQNTPTTAIILQENALKSCGLDIFFEIIKNTSPLGGQLRNLKDYVRILKMSDGDRLLDYYQRALFMYKEITV